MKAIKLINLFILALLCQVVFAQSNDLLKSFHLRMAKSHCSVENWATTGKQTWLIGEDITLSYPYLRNMQDPGSTALPLSWRQPDTFGGGPYWKGENAAAHTNSGIMNHWFYILSVGKSGTNGIGNAYNVTGIGITEAAKIVYRAETQHMSDNTDFDDARQCTIDAAIDLYGDCTPEVIAVANAWHAVGVGELMTSSTSISNVTYVSNTTINACKVILNNVKVKNGAKLTIETNETTFNGDFEVELGSKLEIK